MQSNILTILSFVAAVSAHGMVTSPKPRVAGDAFKTACGNTMLNTEKSDPFGNIQGLRQQAGKDFDGAKCELELCKGYQFADNAANIHSFKAGEKVDFAVEIRAPHTGVANVSIVDTASNSIIGTPLKSFENYASTKTGVAADNKAFSVTLPATLPEKCATAGACVLQWWWDSPEAKQTYMSCVDFTAGACVLQWWWDSPEAKQTYMSCVDFTSGSGGGAAAPAPVAAAPKPATPSAPANGGKASDPAPSEPAACTRRSKRAVHKTF